MSRRNLLTLAAAAPLAAGRQARAAQFEGRTIRVQFWGGSDGLVIRKYVVDPLVKETGARVVVEEAGGRMTDFAGRRDWFAGEALATNGLVHEPILERFGLVSVTGSGPTDPA